MRSSIRTLIHVIAAACVAWAPQPGSASVFANLLVPEVSDRTDFEPLYYAEIGSDGVWSVGRTNNSVLAVKFNPGGRSIAHAYAPIVMDDDFFALRYFDGGLILAGRSSVLGSYSPCVVQRIAADGRLLWSKHVASRDHEDGESCGAMGVDVGGSVWIHLRVSQPGRLLRLSADGNIMVMVDLQQHFDYRVRQLVVDAVSPGVWIGGSATAEAGQSVRARIMRLDTLGQPVWTWDSHRNDTESEVAAMSVSADYGIQALLRTQPRAATTAYTRDLRAVRLSLNGGQLHDRDLRFDRDIVFQGMSTPDASGSWVAVKQSAGTESVSLLRLSLAGAAGELHNLGDTYSCGNVNERFLRCKVYLRQDGGAWFVTHYPDLSPRWPQLIGIDGQGAERFRQPVYSWHRPTQRADDSMLVSAVTLSPPNQTELPIPYTAQFGDHLQQWSEVRDLMPSYFSEPFVEFTRNGDPIIAGNYGNYTKKSLVEFFPSTDSGELPWRSEYPGKWSGKILVSARVACLSGTHYWGWPFESDGKLRCHRREDGAPLWQWTQQYFDQGRALFPLDDGRSVSIDHLEGNVRHTVLDLNGTPQSLVHGYSLQRSPWVIFNDSGDALLMHRTMQDSATALRSLRANGTQRYSVVLTDAMFYNDAFLMQDGSALVWHVRGVERRSADGALMWSHRFNEVSYSTRVQTSDGRFFMLRQTSSTADAPVWNEFNAFDLHSGALLWSRRFRSAAFLLPEIALVGSNGLGAIEAEGSRLRWRVLDRATGQMIREQTDSCGASECLPPRLNVRADGRARVVLPTWSPLSGPGTQVLGLDHAGDVLPAVRADQDGISGAWHSSANTGQGLMIQWLASASTLFAPWFTFSKDGGQAHSELRWYTLQGSVAPGALAAEVGIFRNSGGDFGNGVTTAQRVGSATLSFESCARVHLRYQFDEGINGSASGLVTLSRLTPGVACIGAPATDAAVHSEGLDADFDGAWYDPAASGQGLMFSRFPTVSGNGGTLFAPWFTFDPAASPDDATEQHWFTLQGVYDGSGRTTLTIFRTIGGSFDGTPTSNTQSVGSATLSRPSCDSAQLAYRFHDSDIAGGFRALTGSIALRKVGGCN